MKQVANVRRTRDVGSEQGGGDTMILRKSITVRFIASVILALFIAQAIGLVAVTVSIRAAFLNELETRMKRSAGMVAAMSAKPLLVRDFITLDAYLEEAARDEEILSVHFYDSQGKAIREKIVAKAQRGSFNPLLYRDPLEVTVPVISSGTKIGAVAVHFMPRSLNDAIEKNFLIVMLYQGIVIIFLGFVMCYLFTRNITGPVSLINEALGKITTGDLTVSVPDLGDNEIGTLAKGVTFLERHVSGMITKINEMASGMSKAIRQMEQTSQVVGEGMKRQSASVRDIIRSIGDANKIQNEVSEGMEKLLSFSTDNVTSLLRMKASAESMAAQTQRLFRATEDSYSVVLDMAQSSKVISTSAGEALAAVEDTSASVEEVGASVREVEAHARDSSKIAETVKEITSGEGMMTIVNAVEGIDNIAAQVKISSEIIQRLGMRSVDIEKVLSVIRDVTEQTNLLSLNAAILAAQAGEYGKSFSVVADEIRALSERTASSTREIGGIVKAIQKDIREAVYSVEASQLKVEEGNAVVIKVGEALGEILERSTKSSDMTKAIERATSEQVLGLRQIRTAVDDIRKVMNNVARATSEQENALSYLLEGSGDMKEVADFSKRGAGEQAEGTRVLARNIELANERIGQISSSIVNQKMVNKEIIAALEHIGGVGSSTMGDMEQVTHSLRMLVGEIENLKREMSVFKVT